MKYKQLIYQIKNTSPKVTIEKLKEKIVNKVNDPKQRSWDFANCTYSIKKDLIFRHFELEKFSKQNLYQNYQFIFEKAYKSMKHNFDLLGSGEVNISYNDDFVGFEGFNYRNDREDIYIFKDIDSWIYNNISIGNQSYSKNIIQKIDKNYKYIDWQVDCRSAYRWNILDWYKDIKYGNLKGVDIKLAWELGRMQDCIFLVQAAILNENILSQFEKDELLKQGVKLYNTKEYLDELRNRYFDFIALNPPRFGVQWKTSMDIGIRIVNMLLSINLSQIHFEYFDKEELSVFNSYIYDSLTHILNNNEWAGGARGNHYFANVCSILISTLFFKPNQEMNQWKNWAYEQLSNEIEYQFNEDGGNFEASLPYHFFTSEMLADTLCLLKEFDKQNNSNDLQKLLSRNKQKLTQIYNFSKYSCIDQSIIPQIGDNDSGIYIDFIYTSTSSKIKHILSCFEEILETKNELQNDLGNENENYNIAHHTFENFGLYINNTKFYDFVFRVGDIGQKGKGGHSHNDQLSFELYSESLPIIVDSGTYCYTSMIDQRNNYRSVNSHNCLVIENKEQNLFDASNKDDLFWIREEKTKSKIITVNEYIYIAEHYAYNLPCRRTILFKEDTIFFKDNLDLETNKQVLIHLLPNCLIKPLENSIELKIENQIWHLISDEDIFIEEYFYSPEYGIKMKSKKIIVSSDKNEINWKITRIK